MEIKIISDKKITRGILKPIYSTLHTILVTNATILDYIFFAEKFISTLGNTSDWDELMMTNDIDCFAIIRSETATSFKIHIEDYDDEILELIKNFLAEKNIRYEY